MVTRPAADRREIGLWRGVVVKITAWAEAHPTMRKRRIASRLTNGSFDSAYGLAQDDKGGRWYNARIGTKLTIDRTRKKKNDGFLF